MKDLIKMVVVLTAICIIAAVALSQVDALTKEPIANALRMEKLKALKAVLPPFDNEPDRDTKTLGDSTYYIAKSGGADVGYAFEATSPNGYSGDIKVMVGIDPQGEINGLEILAHKETPGLGQKVETQEWRDSVVWKDEAKTLHRSLRNSNLAVKKDGGDVDQISGATISPRAVVEAVRGGLEAFDTHRQELGLTGKTVTSEMKGQTDAPAVDAIAGSPPQEETK